jgi:uncharacterized protein (DUF58 family)
MALLDTDFITKLEQLELVSHRLFTGRIKGDKRSRRKGTSVEFADYRDYTPGDDLRFIDWNVYSRLERLFVKLFVEEEDLFVFILLDASRSMRYGEPEKWRYARRLAAALGIIALCGQNRVGIRLLGGVENGVFPLCRGRARLWRLIEFLEAAPSGGETDLAGEVGRFVSTVKQSGMVILLSDLFDPDGFERALELLSQRRFEASVIQVLAREEIDPPFRGDYRLLDLETSRFTEISTSGPLLSLYRENLARFCGRVRALCIQYAMLYERITTDQPLEEVVITQLRRAGLLK